MAKYNLAIANYLNEEHTDIPDYLFSSSQEMRYGENPHQKAKLLTFS